MAQKKVGLSVAESTNRAADAVSAITGLTKSEIFARGLKLVEATLSDQQRAAVAACAAATDEAGRR